MGQLEVVDNSSALPQEPAGRAALNDLLIRLRKQQYRQSWPRARTHGGLLGTWDWEVSGTAGAQAAVTGLTPPAVGTMGDPALSPVTDAKSRANAQDRREL